MYLGNASTTQKNSRTTLRHDSSSIVPFAALVNRGDSVTPVQSCRRSAIMSLTHCGWRLSVRSRFTVRWCNVLDGGRLRSGAVVIVSPLHCPMNVSHYVL